MDGVSFELRRGEVLGLVGESGSGKTTLARTILGLATPPREASGSRDTRSRTCRSGRSVRYRRQHADGVPGSARVARTRRWIWRPRSVIPSRIHGIVEGSRARSAGRRPRADSRRACRPVERFLRRLPERPLRWQKQRAVLARAIILDPDLLVADEPVSMLDMSVRAKILELMLHLKDELDLTLPVHHARPRHGEVLLRSGRDHVPRKDRGDRADGSDLLRPEASRTRSR